jgi:prephenate dehydrogenase
VPADLLVVGTGLIGTSIGLALRGQAEVLLHDRDPAALAAAAERGAGRVWNGTEPPAHVVVCAPPSAVAALIGELAARLPDATLSHVSSVQRPVDQVVGALPQVCGSHPMAGKESSGPAAASARLFVGRPWVLCPSPATSSDALAATRRVAEQCGAEPLVTTAAEHDDVVALVSHLPQVTASALAAVLGRADTSLALAGPGLQDTTRIAGSAPGMWVDVLRTNAVAVAPLVRALAEELTAVADALDAGDVAAIERLLQEGNEGRRRVPRKRGEHDRDFALVSVVVPDSPGQLAGVLVAAADAGINVEDVRVDHLPGRPTGVIELLVQPGAQAEARRALTAAGWDVAGG